MLTQIGYIDSKWLWVFLTVLFAVIEVFTFGLVTVWFALSAFIMIFLAFIPKFPFMYQIIVFLILSAAMLIFTRPVAIKKFKTGRVKTNVDSLVGMNAQVTKKISEFDKGEIKLNGQIWSAKSEDGAVLEEGDKCVVVRIEGVHAVVREQGTGNREQGTGNREQGTGNREQVTENREQVCC